MTDAVLEHQPLNNPYRNYNNNIGLSPRHPYNLLKRLLIISASLYGLDHFKLYHTIFHSPDVRHEWFKIGLAASIAVLTLKAYVELYAGKFLKRTVNYENFKTATHLVMVSILIASVSFHVALWPAYGGSKTVLIMFLVGFGVLFQFALFLPTYLQNIIGVVLMTWFLQMYSG